VAAVLCVRVRRPSGGGATPKVHRHHRLLLIAEILLRHITQSHRAKYKISPVAHHHSSTMRISNVHPSGWLVSRAVITLNNSSTSLMERGHFGEAKLALHDALFLQSIPASQQSSSETMESLQNALRRTEKNRAQLNQATAVPLSGWRAVTVLSNDEDAYEEMETAALDFCSAHNMYAVRIDGAEGEDCGDYYHKIVLLLNYAVACQNPSPTTTSSSSSCSEESVYKQAYHVLKQTHKLLKKLASNACISVPPQSKLVVLLHMLVAQNLIHLSNQLKLHSAGTKFYNTLCLLREVLFRDQHITTTSEDRMPLAASYLLSGQQERSAPAA